MIKKFEQFNSEIDPYGEEQWNDDLDFYRVRQRKQLHL